MYPNRACVEYVIIQQQTSRPKLQATYTIRRLGERLDTVIKLIIASIAHNWSTHARSYRIRRTHGRHGRAAGPRNSLILVDYRRLDSYGKSAASVFTRYTLTNFMYAYSRPHRNMCERMHNEKSVATITRLTSQRPFRHNEC